MRLACQILSALQLVVVTCRVVPLLPHIYAVANTTTPLDASSPFAGIETTPALAAGGDPTLLPIPNETPWRKYVCRGQKLWQACISNKDKGSRFAKPLESQWDGTLEHELARWGYTELPPWRTELYCRLEVSLSVEMAALNIDPHSKNEGGPNECFFFQHSDDDAENQWGQYIEPANQYYTVDGKTYRATDAHAIIGANARDGIIYFFSVKSALEAAKETWNVGNPRDDQLPELRQISDMAWAVWRRKHPDGRGLGQINKFLVHHIINPITKYLISEALKTYKVADGETRVSSLPKWPGLTFSMESEEGAAMLGSPDGIAVGYFLSQHKILLGGNKYVYQVQVFADQYEPDVPYLIFWVGNAPRVLEAESQIDQGLSLLNDGMLGTGKVVKRSADGKNVIWEHIIMARL